MPFIALNSCALVISNSVAAGCWKQSVVVAKTFPDGIQRTLQVTVGTDNITTVIGALPPDSWVLMEFFASW